MCQELLSRQSQPVAEVGLRTGTEVDFSVTVSRIDEDCIIGILLNHPTGDVQRMHRFAEGAG